MLYVTLAGVDVSADHALYSPVGQLGLIREKPVIADRLPVNGPRQIDGEPLKSARLT